MSKKFKMAILAALGLFVVIATMMAGNIGFSYDVIYDGEKIGRIDNLSVLKEAKSLVAEKVACDCGSDVEVTNPNLKYTFSFKPAATSAEELSDYIIDNSPNIISGYSVRIDGRNEFFVADKALVESVAEGYASNFNVSGLECTSHLANEIVYTEAFIDDSAVSTEDDIKSILMGLDVITVADKVTEYSVPFETITTRTSKKKTGYIAVTTVGVKGVNEVVEKITYLNGVETSSEVVSDSVVSKPVNEVIVVGTGKSSYSTTVNNASTKGYIWPLASRGVVTSYWGDGRNHKGLDIGAPAGTDILAVKGGTVTFAGWNGDYGYDVVIDHGNGVKTRYAHCSKLFVKTGESVTQGQHIADVGSTGQSTGPHLHFEIIINGTRVDPSPYLGI